MINFLKLGGWLVAVVLLFALILQRACTNEQKSATIPAKTIIVPGDTKYTKVHDTVLVFKPITKLVPGIARHDTIVKFQYRTVYDTIRGQDVDVAISDSLTSDSIINQKVSIKNNREKQINTLAIAKDKLYIGGYIGLGQKTFTPAAGLQLTLITRAENMYFYTFDALTHTHQIGLSWKIHFGKTH